MTPTIANLARAADERSGERSGGDRLAAVRDQVSAEEWRVRCDLAACYRLAHGLGWEDTIFTHFSARVPGPETHYLLNPLGYLFDEVTASSLVKVDVMGNIVLDPTGLGINPAGWIIHGSVHEARADAHCVMHTHTVAGVGVSCQPGGLLPINQQALTIVHDLAYHDFEGIALDGDERARLVAHLGDKNNLILRNHGLLTVGETVGAAFLRMYALSRTCEIQVHAQAGGAAIAPLPDAVIDRVRAQTRKPGGGPIKAADLAWAAMLRRLDRQGVTYAV